VVNVLLVIAETPSRDVTVEAARSRDSDQPKGLLP
jgi:hypothetical protein